MKEHSRVLKRSWILAVGVAVLMTGHVIFFNHLRHAGESAVAVAGLALLAIAKHLGMLGPLYSRFRRRSRN